MINLARSQIEGYIYKLTLLIDTRLFKTGEIYIGKHNGRRKNYFSGGKYIKDIIKKYGKEAFCKEIICPNICSLEELNTLEKTYISYYNCNRNKSGKGLNLTDGGDGALGLSGKFSWKSIPIIQCDMDGKLIKEWENANIAGIELGFHQTAISKAIRNKTYYAHGFLWGTLSDYENTNIKFTDTRGMYTAKPVIQLDLNGCYIKRWESLTLAARELNVSQGSMHNIVGKDNRHYVGYLWCYEEDYLKGVIPSYSKQNIRDDCKKPIIQYDLQNNIIQEFNSIDLATKLTGINKSVIHRYLSGKILKPKKFVWKYK